MRCRSASSPQTPYLKWLRNQHLMSLLYMLYLIAVVVNFLGCLWWVPIINFARTAAYQRAGWACRRHVCAVTRRCAVDFLGCPWWVPLVAPCGCWIR